MMRATGSVGVAFDVFTFQQQSQTGWCHLDRALGQARGFVANELFIGLPSCGNVIGSSVQCCVHLGRYSGTARYAVSER